MRWNIVVGTVACGFVLSLGVAVIGADEEGHDGDDQDNARIQAGFKYTQSQGIKLNLKHRNHALVGLGSYLVNAAGGCNDCHTFPPFTKDPYAFLGAPKQINLGCYLAGGTPFGPPGDPNTPVSRDITPWEDGKPAGLTLKGFVHVMRTGEDPDNPGHVLEVMPWPVYQALTDRDLRAIYEYLLSIPAINANTCGFPSEG
jgi:hypothetical protein